MTNIYFWGKVISPTFQKQSSSKTTSTMVSVHTEEIIKTVECGAENAFLLTDQNQLYAFGSNEDGQMGLSFNPHKNVQLSRVFVPTKTKIVSVSCGWYHTLILDQLGCLFSSGKGSQGAIGQGTKQNSYGFKQIMTGVRKVSAGLDHSLAIKGNKVYGWGNTQQGQLGLHSRKKFFSPKQLNIYPCDQIFAGVKYSIFVTVRGVYGCGMNNNFQLGLGHDKDLYYPKLLQIDDQIVKIWGGNYCFAKNKKGQMYMWGTGAFGVFKYPTKIQFFQGCDQMALGLNFGIVEKDERIYVWGSNNFGELGNHSREIKDYAYQCERLSSFDLALFACGKNFTVGISYGDQAQIQMENNFNNNSQSCANKDQVIEEFGDSQQTNNNNNNKMFKQSLYSSFGSNLRPHQQSKSIFNQSMRTNQQNHPNFMPHLKKSTKMNNSRLSQSNSSQKQKSITISDHTVKRMSSLGMNNLNNHQSYKKSSSNLDPYLSQIQKLAEQLSQLKLQLREKNKRNHSIDQENQLLKQFIKQSLLRNCGDRTIINYPQVYQPNATNNIVESINKLQFQDLEQFGSKLHNLKLILQQVTENGTSQRNSIS